MRKELTDFFSLVIERDMRGLFIKPTRNSVTQFFRYVFVGGLSFIVDAGSLWILELSGLHYLTAAAFGFVIGLVCNYLLSKVLVFTTEQARVGPAAEFFSYALIGLIGLALTEALMFFFTDILYLFFMASKIASAGVVLLWNFFARKYLLYRGIGHD